MASSEIDNEADPTKSPPGEDGAKKAQRALVHEMRNPLTVILGNAQLIRELSPSDDIRSSVDDIHAAAKQLQAIINRFVPS